MRKKKGRERIRRKVGDIMRDFVVTITNYKAHEKDMGRRREKSITITNLEDILA